MPAHVLGKVPSAVLTLLMMSTKQSNILHQCIKLFNNELTLRTNTWNHNITLSIGEIAHSSHLITSTLKDNRNCTNIWKGYVLKLMSRPTLPTYSTDWVWNNKMHVGQQSYSTRQKKVTGKLWHSWPCVVCGLNVLHCAACRAYMNFMKFMIFMTFMKFGNSWQTLLEGGR